MDDDRFTEDTADASAKVLEVLDGVDVHVAFVALAAILGNIGKQVETELDDGARRKITREEFMEIIMDAYDDDGNGR